MFSHRGVSLDVVVGVVEMVEGRPRRSALINAPWVVVVRIATLPRSNLGKDTAGCRLGARVEAE